MSKQDELKKIHDELEALLARIKALLNPRGGVSTNDSGDNGPPPKS